jgi:DNA anti-recombination protein RmuC
MTVRECRNVGDRDSALQDHLLSVRRHVDELASKQYIVLTVLLILP